MVQNHESPRVHLTMESRNMKTGKMPVSSTERSSCPDTCPLINDTCYGEGYHTKLLWDKVDSGQWGMSWSEFCSTVHDFKDGTSWRHDQIGDLPHTKGHLDREKCLRLAVANVNKRGFTFSHHDIHKGDNLETLWLMNELGFVVNLSANTPEHADELLGNDVPVACMLPMDQKLNMTTPKGHKIVVCPATIRDDVTCKSCMLCQRRDRGYVIGFPLHGQAKVKAQAMFFK